MKEPIINWENFQDRLLGEVEVQKKILQFFTTMIPKHIENLKDALNKGENTDCREVERLAHTIKSAALNICADDFAALCLEIEISGKKSNKEKAQNLFTQVLPKFQEVVTEINYFLKKDKENAN